MAEALKNLIRSRGVQLLSRYAAVGLTWLSAKECVAIPDADAAGCSNTVALLVGAGLCLLVDLISHTWQRDEKDDAGK